MQKLAAQGTTPEYVSIGNEMQTGLFYGNWEKAYNENNPLYYNADILARFVNAGAKAVREVSPSSKVVVHSDNGGKVSSTRNAFIGMLSKADYDVIGVSFYPYYNSDVTIDTVAAELSDFVNKYNKDVIIMETGYNWSATTPYADDPTTDEFDESLGQLKNSGYYTNIYGQDQNGQRAFLTELYAKLKQVVSGRCIADLYWDPVMIYDGGVEHTRDTGIGWAISEETDITADNVVPNSTIFDFSGKAVAGQLAMKYNTNSSDKVLITGKVTNDGRALADTNIKISVNGSDVNTTTDKFGEYTIPEIRQLYYSRTDGQITYMYGPITLAAELEELEGHEGVVEYVANETTLDSKAVDVPYLYVNGADPASLVEMIDSDTLTFKINGEHTSTGETITLKPFFAIHHHFHNVYWDMDNDPNGYGKALNAVTVDAVEPDGRQDEIGHMLTSNDSHNGSFTSGADTYFWRDAWGSDDAYFGYTMNVNDDVKYLMVRYWGPDGTFTSGGTYTRDFNIYIDDILISDQQLPILGESGAVDKFYKIPAELLNGKTSVNVKFAAKNSTTCAGGVLQIRTVSDTVNIG